MNLKLIAFILLSSITSTYAQIDPIGSWRTYMPYQQGIEVLNANDKIYGICNYGIFSLTLKDSTIDVISKVDGLSEVQIQTAAYDLETSTLVVCYANTNIDIIKGNTILNVNDILKQEVTGIKTINSVNIFDGIAYINCGFATVLYDINKEEIKDTYYLGNNGSNLGVYSISILGDKIYAATDSGILEAQYSNPNLSNYQNWTRHGNQYSFPKNKKIVRAMVNYSDNLYAFIQDSLYVFDGNAWKIPPTIYQGGVTKLKVRNNKLIIINGYSVVTYNESLNAVDVINTPNYININTSADFDSNNKLWISNLRDGIQRIENNTVMGIYHPDGPFELMSRRLAIENGKIIVASGTVGDNYSNKFTLNGIYQLENKQWKNYNYLNYPIIDSFFDITTVVFDPKTNKEYYGTFWKGIVEFNNNEFVKNYSYHNSTLGEALGNDGQYRITGMAFDSKNQLWVSNYWATKPISVLKTNGQWQAFEFPGVFSEFKYVADITIDRNDQKWVIIPGSNAILVFKENANGTVTYKKLGSGEGSGNLPKDATEVLSITEDLDGRIWVGTSKGLVVFYSPSSILTPGANIDGQPIKVIDGEFVQSLLENESVTTIEIDGANRKWIGTKNGVWLFSADGTEQIHYFNKENSPILSNRINDIVIDPRTGEVYFATDNGIISYRNDATVGDEQNQELVKVFPNPVKENYEGPIAIDGLVQNAQVKITDANGRIVFTTVANGAQAIWYGKNFSGERVQSGIYFVFSTNDAGEEKMVNKIAFIH